MLRKRGDVGLAMIDAISSGWRHARSGTRRVRCWRVGQADLDRVERPIMRWWNEAQIVFVAEELGDLSENRGKILGGYGEVRAPAIGFGDGP